MSDRDQQDSTRGSGGPEIETPTADANTDAAELDVNPEIHPAATDDLSDPDELPQVDEEIARGRKGS